jgi:hypothetical protein
MKLKVNKCFFAFVFAVITIKSYAGPLDEYEQLLSLLRSYNTPGYTRLINSEQGVQYRRGKIVKTGAQFGFIPSAKGFFQFYDTDKKCFVTAEI